MTVSKRRTFRNLMLATTLLASPMMLASPIPASAQAEIGISVQIAPPILPYYAQPPLPELGYIWTPGYWQWAQQGGYYWVPGTWILPPSVGMLWTPPYWAWANGGYLFHAGYWGPHVGYYGGINYGYGYGGTGYDGGRWDGSNFLYNRTANNFGKVKVANAYAQPVAVVNRTKVSYAGGAHGLKTQPVAAEGVAEHEQHAPATAEQTKHVAAAVATPALAVSHNKGRPPIAATSHAAQFKGPGVVSAAQPAKARAASVAPRPAAIQPAHATAPPPAARTEAAPHPAPAARTAAAPHPAPAARTEAAPPPAARSEAAPPAPAREQAAETGKDDKAVR